MSGRQPPSPPGLVAPSPDLARGIATTRPGGSSVHQGIRNFAHGGQRVDTTSSAMNKKSQRRWTPAGVRELECRALLTAALPTATWVGQDGHDLVGPYSYPVSDDVQDIH